MMTEPMFRQAVSVGGGGEAIRTRGGPPQGTRCLGFVLVYAAPGSRCGAPHILNPGSIQETRP